MSELQALVQWIADLLSEYLYTGVFLAALLETIIPPDTLQIVSAPVRSVAVMRMLLWDVKIWTTAL